MFDIIYMDTNEQGGSIDPSKNNISIKNVRKLWLVGYPQSEICNQLVFSLLSICSVCKDWVGQVLNCALF